MKFIFQIFNKKNIVEISYCRKCSWASSGYCPVPTKRGCVSINKEHKGSIEDYEQYV